MTQIGPTQASSPIGTSPGPAPASPRGRGPSSRTGLAVNGLCFALGVGLLQLFSRMPPLWPWALAALLLCAAAWRLRLLRPLAFGGLGLLWAQVNACHILCDPFPEHLVRQDLQVVGIVASLPEQRDWATRFLFQVQETSRGTQSLPFRGLVRLSWYRGAPPLLVGERRRLSVRLKSPHGLANPGGFDYERWLFQQGIRATGYVRSAAGDGMLEPGPGAFLIDRWRQGLRDHLARVLGDSPATGFVQALVLGERSALTPGQWEVLTRTGTNHLIAISGLHVGLVATFLFFLFRWVWSRSARLVLLLAAPRAAALGALMGALAYSALAGFAVSTQRAIIMLAVVLGSVLFSRTTRPASGLALALVGVLILDPRAVLSYGFWLSFGAVAVLFHALGSRLPSRGLWSRWGNAQWAVALGLLPMLLLLFGRASLIAPLVNLVAVPLFGLVLLPLTLVSAFISQIPGLEAPLLLTARLLEQGFVSLEAVAGWEWSAASIPGGPVWVWAAAFSGALLLLAPRGFPARWLGLILLLPLPLLRPPVPAQGEFWFTLLDVGQGLSAVVRTHRHTLVFDTGPGFSSGFNTGAAVLVPFLRDKGVANLDLLILSHGDRDHVGGLGGLASGMPIGRILAGEPDEVVGAEAEPCRAGERWTWDGVEFAFLHPVEQGRKGNDNSCVLRLSTTRGDALLLPGDIEKGVEHDLVEEQGEALTSRVLVAGHHGSSTSSSQSFLQAVSPRWVLFASGYANRFGFPTDPVRKRVAELGASGLETSATGAIGFRFGDAGLVGPRLFRAEHPRLWRRPSRLGEP